LFCPSITLHYALSLILSLLPYLVLSPCLSSRPHAQAIESAKARVGDLISHAKQLGQAVNAARDHIIELKALAKKLKVLKKTKSDADEI
jgi:hypothetical protein